MKKNKNSLIGKWFHRFGKSGFFKWQGQILSAEPDNYYLIQLYCWVYGHPTDQKSIPFSEMADWIFYESSQEMTSAYKKTVKQSEVF